MRVAINDSDSKIPIRNIWLLILFASKFYRKFDDLSKKYRFGSVEQCLDDIIPFVANLLINATERRLRRSLNHQFERKTAELARVRGRIDLLLTERKQLLQKGRVSCRFFNLSVNTACNRYVKAALERAYELICKQRQIRPYARNVAQRSRCLAATMNLLGVVGAKPLLTGEQELLLHRHDWDERLMYFAATLIHELDIPAQDSEDYWQWSTRQDRKFLQDLFEKAVAGFYSASLDAKWKVARQERQEWPVSAYSNGGEKWLPKMQKDVDLVNIRTGHQIIIDTKFSEVLKENRVKELKFRSANMYQIYSYIKTQDEFRDSSIQQTDGLLLYPAVRNTTIDEFVVVQGHRLRFRTVDLAQPSNAIQLELLSIIEDWPYQK